LKGRRNKNNCKKRKKIFVRNMISVAFYVRKYFLIFVAYNKLNIKLASNKNEKLLNDDGQKIFFLNFGVRH
jgi:hypothetical protein